MKKTPNYVVGDIVNLTFHGASSIPRTITSRLFKDGRWRYLVEPYGHGFSVIAPWGAFGINKPVPASCGDRVELVS